MIEWEGWGRPARGLKGRNVRESEGKKKRVLELRGRACQWNTEKEESWVAAPLIKHSNPSVSLRNSVRRLVLKADPQLSCHVSIHTSFPINTQTT